RDAKSFDAGLITNGDAVLDQPRADRLEHTEQQVRADVWLRVDEDALGCARLDEPLEDLAHEWVAGPASQLAVAVGAGAAFAETKVGLGIELGFAAKTPEVACPCLDRLAALDQGHPRAALGEVPGREQTGGPGADDDHRRCVALRAWRHEPCG